MNFKRTVRNGRVRINGMTFEPSAALNELPEYYGTLEGQRIELFLYTTPDGTPARSLQNGLMRATASLYAVDYPPDFPYLFWVEVEREGT